MPFFGSPLLPRHRAFLFIRRASALRNDTVESFLYDSLSYGLRSFPPSCRYPVEKFQYAFGCSALILESPVGRPDSVLLSDKTSKKHTIASVKLLAFP
jgi:hypothetical protein